MLLADHGSLAMTTFEQSRPHTCCSAGEMHGARRESGYCEALKMVTRLSHTGVLFVVQMRGGVIVVSLEMATWGDGRA